MLMNFHHRWLGRIAIYAALAVGCGDGGGGSGGSGGSSGTDAAPADAGLPDAAPGPDAAVGPLLNNFLENVSDEICEALFRCCNGADLELYYSLYIASDLLNDFDSMLPPASESTCKTVMPQMLAITPFGDWVEGAQAGRIDVDPGAYESCVRALSRAECGQELRAALADPTCFGFVAPAGGSEQRSMFARTGRVGDACSAIRDGDDAAIYGTCNPRSSFCCYEDPAMPGQCGEPFDASGAPRSGRCQQASAEGASCMFAPCTTGLICANTLCTAPPRTPLGLGEICVDGSGNSLGICQGSYCDSADTTQCQAFEDVGSPCAADIECASQLCGAGGQCADNTVCTAP